MLEDLSALMAAGDAELEFLAVRPPWQSDSACREHPEVNFFPGQGETLDPARAVCAACLVRTECLDYAMSLPVPLYGVWGGTSDRERRAIRARRAA